MRSELDNHQSVLAERFQHIDRLIHVPQGRVYITYLWFQLLSFANSQRSLDDLVPLCNLVGLNMLKSIAIVTPNFCFLVQRCQRLQYYLNSFWALIDSRVSRVSIKKVSQEGFIEEDYLVRHVHMILILLQQLATQGYHNLVMCLKDRVM